ncbi:MAG: 50S ribosomal protein L10 [Candidatus Peribacteria bacterium]|nr:50S ribosomal protein L10 [Candidatus Peribacteria bacterium]
MTVEEFARLRKNLREINASYTLAKKTIIKKALKEALNIDIELVDLN